MSEEHEDRMEVKFCGMVLGSASDWDQVADEIIHFYDFLSGRPEFPDSNGLNIDYLNGIFTFHDADGKPVKEFMISLGFNPI